MGINRLKAILNFFPHFKPSKSFEKLQLQIKKLNIFQNQHYHFDFIRFFFEFATLLLVWTITNQGHDEWHESKFPEMKERKL